MPHTKSAKKHLRKSAKQRLANRAVKKGVRLEIKKFLEVVDNKESTAEQLKAELSQAVKKLDKAAAKHVVHRNMASRKKSQLALMVNTRLAKSSAPPAPAGK